MTRPENPFEALSYDLNKFRERRLAERRSVPRDTVDRRSASFAMQPPAQTPRLDGDAPGQST